MRKVTITVLIILLLGFSLFVWKAKTQPLPTEKQESQDVVVQSPRANSSISSPLTITGKIPGNWMFEGSFPILLQDENHQLIGRTQAKETIPGSWQTTKLVEFTVTLTFETSAKNGFLIFKNDNPSGLPENEKIFEVPVKFNPYSCPINGWINCMPILSEDGKKACSKEAVDWYKQNCPNFQGMAQ